MVAVAVTLPLCACRHTAPPPPHLVTSEALAPSPRLTVGRVIAIDADRGFAFVELAYDHPAAATAEGAELVSRTLELSETARLRASRQIRGRTLGTLIVAGKPGPGDEVVWSAP